MRCERNSPAGGPISSLCQNRGGVCMKFDVARAVVLFLAPFLFFSADAHAQRPMSTAEVLSFVKSQVKIGDDRATADFLLHKVRLTEKLDLRDVEDLQGQG